MFILCQFCHSYKNTIKSIYKPSFMSFLNFVNLAEMRIKSCYHRNSQLQINNDIKRLSFHELQSTIETIKIQSGLKSGQKECQKLIFCLFDLGTRMKFRRNYKRAVECLADAKMIAEVIRNKKMKRQVMFSLADILNQDNKFEEAIQEYLMLRKIYEGQPLGENMALIEYNLGVVHENYDRIMTAVDQYHKAAKIVEQLKLKDPQWIPNIDENIANCYYILGQNTKAQQFYEKALKTWQKLRRPSSIIICQFRLARVYYHNNQCDKCLKLLYRCLALGKYEPLFRLADRKNESLRWIRRISEEDNLRQRVYNCALKVLQRNWEERETTHQVENLKKKLQSQ